MYIMDDIKNRLTDFKYNFLSEMKEYLETDLLFYGSIKRLDYFETNSETKSYFLISDSSILLKLISLMVAIL